MQHRSIAIVAAAIVLVAASLACQAVTGTGTAQPAASGAATVAPDEPAAPMTPPEPEAADDQCIPADEVTVGMQDETVCFRGVITKFDQSRQLGTRYSFSDDSDSVFLYSINYEIIDPNTGKTIAPGTCVEIVGPIRVEGERPAVYLDPIMDDDSGDSGAFYFYDDTSYCQ